MLGNCRECPSETETVGEENVGAFNAELRAVELLAEHDVAYGRFYRWHNGVCGVPRCTAYVPPAIFDEFLHLLILQGIIFLHP